jgi:hypothetical protein
MGQSSPATTLAQAVSTYALKHANLTFVLLLLVLIAGCISLALLARQRIKYRRSKSNTKIETIFESAPPPVFHPDPIPDFSAELNQPHETVVLSFGEWVLSKRQHRAS